MDDCKIPKRLTKAEKEAAVDLKAALEVLGERHWLFAASGELYLMRLDKDGKRYIHGGALGARDGNGGM